MLVDDGLAGGVPCRAWRPEEGRPDMVIVAVHGLGGSKGRASLAVLAAAMCAQWCAVVAFDFPAHGEHPQGELSVSGCGEALLNAVAFAKSRFPTAKVGMFATSFGDYVTFLNLTPIQEALGDQPPIVLRAPAVRMALTMKRILGRKGMDELHTRGATRLPHQRSIIITRRFVEQLQRQDASDKRIGKALVIHGDRDELVTDGDILPLIAANDRARLVTLGVSGTGYAAKRWRKRPSLHQATSWTGAAMMDIEAKHPTV